MLVLPIVGPRRGLTDVSSWGIVGTVAIDGYDGDSGDYGGMFLWSVDIGYDKYVVEYDY
jgi:hypothetical protein